MIQAIVCIVHVLRGKQERTGQYADIYVLLAEKQTEMERDNATLKGERNVEQFIDKNMGGVPEMTDIQDRTPKEQEPATVKAEIEGGGSNWWYVCSECHGAIDKSDQYCRHCGGRIIE